MTIAFQGMQNCHTQTKVNFPAEIDLKAFKSNIFNELKSDKVELRPKDTIIGATPRIGFMRLLFNRLTKEQIDGINQSGKLPKNAKFVENMGKINIAWNLADITTGTHELPKGYEVKNDIFGFTHVVREGTKNIFIK